MKTAKRNPSEKVWQKFWDEMQEEFFKVEVLQYYDEDDSSSLREWTKSNREKSIALAKKEFKPWAKGKEKVKKTRVHIVEKPLSPYLEWEIELYKLINIPIVGEEVYLLDKKYTENVPAPEDDIMVFDTKRVIANHYDHKGYFLSADIYDEEDDISKFLELREMLLKMPLEKVSAN